MQRPLPGRLELAGLAGPRAPLPRYAGVEWALAGASGREWGRWLGGREAPRGGLQRT